MCPVHFGVILIENLCIGLCTPPVGTCLFIGCGIGKAMIAKISKAMRPFCGTMIGDYLLPLAACADQAGQVKKDDVEKSHFMREKQRENRS